MLNNITSSKTAIPQSVGTSATSRKQSKIKRERIVRYQLLSEQERIKRKQPRVTEQHQTVKAKNIMERYPIAARIYMATKDIWRRESPCHDTSATTSKSPSGNSSERNLSLETEGTSCSESGNSHLTEALEKKTYQCAALESKLANVEQKLSDANDRHQALEQKYSEQRAQRIKYKVMVDQWCNQVKEVDAYCEELEDSHQAMQDEMEKQAEQHCNALEAKDQELTKLIADHKAELEARNQEAAQVQQELQTKHQEEMRVQIKSSKTNRAAWEEARKAVEAKALHMEVDYRDARQADKEEIKRLTESKRRSEADNRMLTSLLNNARRDHITQEVQRMRQNTEKGQRELQETRTQLKISQTKIENILEAMQQERDHWDAQREKETEAQAQVYDLRKQICELQEKLVLRDDLLRAKDDSEIVSASADVGSVAIIALRNDELCDELKAARKENDELQVKVSKVENENFDLSFKIDTVEEQLHEASGSLKALQQKQEIFDKERKFLINAVDRHQGLTSEDKSLLQQHLREITHCNQQLKQKEDELLKEMLDLEDHIQMADNKAQNEVDEAKKWTRFWQTMYWDEVVPKVKLLRKEISDLNKELGREPIQVQERLERNAILADRNALRVACEGTLRGVDSALIPAEYYEPGFHGGAIPATYDALRTLRPLGWGLLEDLGKLWLTPMCRPYTEEDAAYRLKAQEQAARKAHREQMGYLPPPGKGVSYQGPDDHAEAHRGAQVGDSLAPGNPFRNANAVNARPTSGFVPTQARAIKQAPAARAAQQMMSKISSQEAEAPLYQSSWLQLRSDLTREAYDDMDTDLKLDVLKMIGIDVD